MHCWWGRGHLHRQTVRPPEGVTVPDDEGPGLPLLQEADRCNTTECVVSYTPTTGRLVDLQLDFIQHVGNIMDVRLTFVSPEDESSKDFSSAAFSKSLMHFNTLSYNQSGANRSSPQL